MMNTNGITLGKCLRSFIFGALLLGASSQAALATVMLTSSRAAIGPGYTVDWGAPSPTDLTSLGSPFTQGAVTVSGGTDFALFSGSSFNANFLATDWILSLYDLTNFNPLSGIFSINFGTAVSSAGAQVQSNLFGVFTGMIRAFDVANVMLGSFNVSGSTGTNGDGSAVFAGITSDALNISRIEFSGFGDGAGINQLSVGNTVTTVPEPATLLLLMGPLAFLVVARRRRGRA